MSVLERVSQAYHEYAKGKTHNAVSIGGGGAFVDVDLVTAGFNRLKLQMRMTAAAAGDLVPRVIAYEDDGVTANNDGGIWAPFVSGPALSAGVTYWAAMYELGGVDKVSVRMSNANAGAQTGTCVYFLQK